MPTDSIKRRIRRMQRKARNWGTIAKLTLSGNGVERHSSLRNASNPVLMIYGFGATRRTLSILENRLRQDGYTIFSLNLGGLIGTFNTDSIEETARKIDKKVERLYKRYNIKGKMDIVGHSKGGLIGQYYVKFLSGRTRVRTLITLGTPHNGNPWALIGSLTPLVWVSKSLGQMSPLNNFIKKLREKPFPKKLKVYSIYSKADVVCPFPVSVIEEANPNIVNIEIPNVSHSELLIKKSVFNAIKHGLQDDMPESWTETSRKSYEEHLQKKKKTKTNSKTISKSKS